MSNLKILLKNNYNLFLGRLAGKKKRKSTIVATCLLVLGIIGIIALYTSQAYAMFKGGLPPKMNIFHAILTSLSVIVIIGIMRSSANQKHSDSDLLLSLPINKRDIIIAKTINKYIFDFFFAFLLFMPYLVIYQIKAGFNATLFCLGILYVLLLPLLSIGISYICDFIISRLFNKMKLGSLLKSFTIILIFVLVMILMLTKTFTYGSTIDMTDLNAYFKDRPITNFVLSFLFTPNALNITVCLAVAIFPFVIGLILYSVNIGKTFAGYSSRKKELHFSDSKSPLGLLYKKELFNYAQTPAYMINTIIGGIVIVVLGIFLSSLGYDGITTYLGGFTLPKPVLSGIFALAFSVLISTAPISASSISLEGKNMWILKSSPINENTIFLSKALLHFSILQPCITFSSLLLTLCLKLSFLEFIIALILPTLLNLISAFGGVLINLALPKLDFDDETKVVKQSLSVLLTMIFSVLIAIIPFGIYKLFTSLSIGVIFAISSALLLIILAIVVILTFTVGKKLFRKIS